MQKIGRASAQVAGRFLFLGVSVQILLGICFGASDPLEFFRNSAIATHG